MNRKNNSDLRKLMRVSLLPSFESLNIYIMREGKSISNGDLSAGEEICDALVFQ